MHFAQIPVQASQRTITFSSWYPWNWQWTVPVSKQDKSMTQIQHGKDKIWRCFRKRLLPASLLVPFQFYFQKCWNNWPDTKGRICRYLCIFVQGFSAPTSFALDFHYMFCMSYDFKILVRLTLVVLIFWPTGSRLIAKRESIFMDVILQ